MIEFTPAWQMYAAQMRDLGVKVEFGRPLTTRGGRIEARLQAKWQAENPGLLERQAKEWADKCQREREQARNWTRGRQ